ncbi:GNAT family N-acetyltransferase [Duganella sp. BJB475]|uniref:GNAT family N-acetyltransferase n=1 Tax=Duganella sp. BJB475 TaxID=2233914 RepID=UPI000E353ACB|nr:GNAT family N-acetyltransferase [Duganella sp. BJB475]RFP12082.1 N-acetyltransferase [Duganella sp. BJB475]
MSRTKKIQLRLRRRLRHASSRLIFAGLLVLETLIFVLDLDTGAGISYSPFLMAPTALAAWLLGRRHALLFVVLSSVARVYDYATTRGLHDGPALLLYELLQSALLFGIVALLVLYLRGRRDALLRHARKVRDAARRERHRRRLDSSIRRAIPEDVAAIIRLTTSGGESGGFDQTVTDSVRQAALAATFTAGIVDGAALRDLWSGGQSTVPIEFWVCEIDARVVSYMMILGVDGQKSMQRELHAMVVEQPYRGHGVGAMMVDFFCTHYKHRRLVAACRDGSAMLRLLTRRGFAQLTRSDNQDYLILARD